jgi:Major Facilitator Superfamily
MKHRHRVLGLLVLLFAITYIDRVCISVAGPRIQEDLHIDPVGWGWVTAMFALSYCLFEIPTGALGDRMGPRRVDPPRRRRAPVVQDRCIERAERRTDRHAHAGARWLIDIRESYHRLPTTGPKAGGGRRWWVADS